MKGLLLLALRGGGQPGGAGWLIGTSTSRRCHRAAGASTVSAIIAGILRFSVAHQITGTGAWVAALIIMALVEVTTRLVVLRLRASRLPAAVRATALVPACEQA